VGAAGSLWPQNCSSGVHDQNGAVREALRQKTHCYPHNITVGIVINFVEGGGGGEYTFRTSNWTKP